MNRLIAVTVWTLCTGCGTALAADQIDTNPSGAVSAAQNTAAPSAAAPGTSSRTSPATGVQSQYQSNTVNSSASGAVTDNFIKDAAQDGSAEVAAAQFAIANSHSADVQQFARQMVTDHGKSDAQLQDIAARKGITVPTDLDSVHKAVIDKLKGKTGADFDGAYARVMAADHQDAVAKFKQAAQDNQLDSEVKNFAQANLPRLQDHLTQANKLVATHASRSNAKEE